MGIVAKLATSSYMQAISIIPECNDDSVVELFKSTISDSPQGRTGGLKLLVVKDFKDVSSDKIQATIWLHLNVSIDPRTDIKNNPRRFCEADAFLNSGEQEISFSLKWIDKPHGQLFLEMLN
jgi:hypothetical protein